MRTIALIAHDRRKKDMLDWVEYNSELLSTYNIVATGTTGKLIEKLLNVPVDKKASGPMGGDAEIAAMVVNKEIDFCVFLIDDLNPNPHEADIQMLLRQCRIHNIPVACNRSSADFILTSDLWLVEYTPLTPVYTNIL